MAANYFIICAIKVKYYSKKYQHGPVLVSYNNTPWVYFSLPDCSNTVRQLVINKKPDICLEIIYYPISTALHILIDGSQKADRLSQKKLYMYLYEFGIGICLRYVSTHDEAVEVLNDGFLKIFKELPKFSVKHDNVEAALRAWVRQILINTAIDHYRKNKKHKLISELNETSFDVEWHGENQLDRLSYKEIIDCIQELPPSYRTVFSLFVLDGFTHEDISKALGINIGTSKSNLSKARMHLQKKMLNLIHKKGYEQRAV